LPSSSGSVTESTRASTSLPTMSAYLPGSPLMKLLGIKPWTYLSPFGTFSATKIPKVWMLLMTPGTVSPTFSCITSADTKSAFVTGCACRAGLFASEVPSISGTRIAIRQFCPSFSGAVTDSIAASTSLPSMLAKFCGRPRMMLPGIKPRTRLPPEGASKATKIPKE